MLNSFVAVPVVEVRRCARISDIDVQVLESDRDLTIQRMEERIHAAWQTKGAEGSIPAGVWTDISPPTIRKTIDMIAASAEGCGDVDGGSVDAEELGQGFEPELAGRAGNWRQSKFAEAQWSFCFGCYPVNDLSDFRRKVNESEVRLCGLFDGCGTVYCVVSRSFVSLTLLLRSSAEPDVLSAYQ